MFSPELLIPNNTLEVLTIWLEPWAFDVSIPADNVCKLVGNSAVEGEFELVTEDNSPVVYCWDGSNLQVYLNDVLEIDTDEFRVPTMAGDLTAKDAVQILFRDKQSRLLEKSAPWWKLW